MILSQRYAYMNEFGGDAGGGGGDVASSEGAGEVSGESVSEGDAPSEEGEVNDAVPAENENPIEGSPEPEWSWDDHMDRTLTTKINGKEQEISLARMIQEYQKGQAAHEKFEAATQREKQAMSILDGLRQDPASALQKLGLDPFDFAMNYLDQQVKLSEETPEQKQLRELQEYKDQVERERQQSEEIRKQQEQQAQFEAAKQQLDIDISEAMKKHKLFQDTNTVKAIASYMHSANQQGLEMTPDQAARLVAEDHRKFVQHMAKMGGDDVLGLFGEEVAEKIRKKDLERLKVQEQQTQQQPDDGVPLADRLENAENLSLKERNKLLRKQLGL
jgi:hypothetical protein